MSIYTTIFKNKTLVIVRVPQWDKSIVEGAGLALSRTSWNVGNDVTLMLYNTKCQQNKLTN
jgi:pantothenate kinase-related protein Tda10